jgi:hypothetical protein
VLEKIQAPDMRIYAVYLPILGGDQVSNVPSAIKRIPDRRVSYFWDGKGDLGRGYSRVLQLPEGQTAWDVYLVFDRDVEWQNGLPPVPNFWMHQLREVSPDRRLDADRLADEINKLFQTEK